MSARDISAARRLSRSLTVEMVGRCPMGSREENATHDVRHDPAVPVVVSLAWRVEPHRHRKARMSAVDGRGAVGTGQPGDGEGFVSGQAERLGIVAAGELQRQDAHADEVGTVDSFERPGDRAGAVVLVLGALPVLLAALFMARPTGRIRRSRRDRPTEPTVPEGWGTRTLRGTPPQPASLS
jgi:hypothetical protein